jgi:cyclopropane-fatty-acyl-phospholipid synthase
MSVKKPNVELSSDIDFIKTPAAKPSEFETGKDCGIALTKVSLSCAIASFSKAC